MGKGKGPGTGCRAVKGVKKGRHLIADKRKSIRTINDLIPSES